MSEFPTPVIPEAAQRLSGTHTHRSILKTPRIWVPDKPCGLSGMTVRGTPQ